MPIPVACGCGQSSRVKDEFAGRKIRCRSCGAVLVVPRPEPAGDVEDEASDLLLADSPSSRPMPPRAVEAVTPRREAALPPPARQPPRPVPPVNPPEKASRPRVKAARGRKSEGSGFSIAVHPAIIAGLLMMAGAAVWFFLGLAAGIIYFYPPVLFVLGVGAVIRGFTGRE
jgi:hypothetical protein